MSDKKLTKEQAHALYDDLHRAVQARMGGKVTKEQLQAAAAQKSAKDKESAESRAATTAASRAAGKAAYAKPNTRSSAPAQGAGSSTSQRFMSRFPQRKRANGQGMALMVLAFLGCAKIALSALEVSGIGRVEEAKAVVVKAPTGPNWSKEEAKILTALDARRVELEERGARLDRREDEFSSKERELAIRLTELKDLSERLKVEREKGEKQKNTQLDQLANVYGSMNPPEAAHLLEQLDIQVALSLVERMPEKRMAQILSLMNPQRALELTNLLTHRTRN